MNRFVERGRNISADGAFIAGAAMAALAIWAAVIFLII